MKLLVVGAGAVGGYFGGRLAEAGADVTFLVRPRRREQIEQDGLRVRSPLGDLQLAARTVSAEELAPDYDVVLLACKAYDLDSAIDVVGPAIDGPCAVVPLLNGLGHMARLDARLGRERVMGGTCTISVTMGKDGAIDHLNSTQRLIFGERDRTASARGQALAGVLARTKIDWELSEDIERSMWEKLVFLSVLAATTCLFRANIGEIIAAPGGRAVIERALDANIAVSTREGHPPRDENLAFARRGLTDPASTWNASMLRDIEAGGRVESEQIVGWILDKARAHGVDDSVLSLAYTHLKAYEARRAAGRTA